MKLKKYLIVLLGFFFLGLAACKEGNPTTPSFPDIKLPTIETFIASSTNIKTGQSTTLSWSVKNATEISVDQRIGTVSASGTKEVFPLVSTTYILTASNKNGQKTAAVSITVGALEPPIINFFSVTPTTKKYKENIPVTLTWSVSKTTNVMIDNGVGSVSAVDSLVINPIHTTTWILTATNLDGIATESCTITITPRPILILVSYRWGCGNPCFHLYAYTKVINEGNKTAETVRCFFKVFDGSGTTLLSTVVEVAAHLYPGETVEFLASTYPIPYYAFDQVNNTATFEFYWLHEE